MAKATLDHESSAFREIVCGRHLPFLSAALAVGMLGLKAGLLEAAAVTVSSCLFLVLILWTVRWCEFADEYPRAEERSSCADEGAQDHATDPILGEFLPAR